MLFEYDTLQFIWWVLVGVLLIGFALTNGMDMAVSVLVMKVGRTDKERQAIISTITPHWDGNQVWLITAGGAVFAAWPEVYAASFSGLYWAMLLVLFSIWLRPLAFDYRNHYQDLVWRKRWDIALFVGSFVPMLVFGVAFGNLLQGLPFYTDESARWYYDGVFLTALLPLLNPFALICGLVSVAMLVTLGSIWIQLRTVESIGSRAKVITEKCAYVTIGLFLFAGLCALLLDGYNVVSYPVEGSFEHIKGKEVEVISYGLFLNYIDYPITILVPLLAVVGMYGAAHFNKQNNLVKAIISCSVGIACIIMTPAVALFPFIMPSSIDPSSSLTVWDATSSHLTLNAMLYAAIIFVPISLGYTIWAYKRMWGKASIDNQNSYH